jgi:hypothetical protein
VTVEQFKALPVGTLVKIMHEGDHGAWFEIGEIIETGPVQAIIIWPNSGVKQFVGFTSSWVQFIEWLEVEE